MQFCFEVKLLKKKKKHNFIYKVYKLFKALSENSTLVCNIFFAVSAVQTFRKQDDAKLLLNTGLNLQQTHCQALAHTPPKLTVNVKICKLALESC